MRYCVTHEWGIVVGLVRHKRMHFNMMAIFRSSRSSAIAATSAVCTLREDSEYAKTRTRQDGKNSPAGQRPESRGSSILIGMACVV
jgi:hypothetical protein